MAEIDEDELRRLYVEERLSGPRCARRMGFAVTTVYGNLQRLGIVRPARGSSALDEGGPQEREVSRLYVEDGLSGREIADRLKVAPHTVYNSLRRQGVPRRQLPPRGAGRATPPAIR